MAAGNGSDLTGSEALELERFMIKARLEMQIEKAKIEAQKMELEIEKERIQAQEIELKKLEGNPTSNGYNTCGGLAGRIHNIPEFTESGADNFFLQFEKVAIMKGWKKED